MTIDLLLILFLHTKYYLSWDNAFVGILEMKIGVESK
jgi:hypothetical protein